MPPYSPTSPSVPIVSAPAWTLGQPPSATSIPEARSQWSHPTFLGYVTPALELPISSGDPALLTSLYPFLITIYPPAFYSTLLDPTSQFPVNNIVQNLSSPTLPPSIPILTFRLNITPLATLLLPLLTPHDTSTLLSLSYPTSIHSDTHLRT
ncbi:uncharacterized protein EI90DRAFT_3131418 [Cantharellus anzutake]|uniref:uncharacterized protein n=1 Tax=Cantharellus anzutake TaxID=1750568 RepID=UPI001906D4A0|nr:uncharacterized protein EI90DRAFT_3131418 [Cantharellus anzutake]KAF8321883.1 hypothetical protein EI90DRAFT_3131418 [Cantharellus anzutake]